MCGDFILQATRNKPYLIAEADLPPVWSHRMRISVHYILRVHARNVDHMLSYLSGGREALDVADLCGRDPAVCNVIWK